MNTNILDSDGVPIMDVAEIAPLAIEATGTAHNLTDAQIEDRLIQIRKEIKQRMRKAKKQLRLSTDNVTAAEQLVAEARALSPEWRCAT